MDYSNHCPGYNGFLIPTNIGVITMCQECQLYVLPCHLMVVYWCWEVKHGLSLTLLAFDHTCGLFTILLCRVICPY